MVNCPLMLLIVAVHFGITYHEWKNAFTTADNKNQWITDCAKISKINKN